MANQIVVAQFVKTLAYLPIYVAQRRGFFKNEGLDVSIVDAFGDHSTWDMVASGKAQFGVADPLLMVDDRDVKGVVVATILDGSVIYGITRKPVNLFAKALDFSGKTVAVFQSPSTAYVLLTKIAADCTAAGGLEPDLVEIEPTTEMGYLARSNIDVVMMVEPSASAAEHEGAKRVFSGRQYFGRYINTGVFGRADYVDSNQQITQGVVSAIRKSMQLIHEDHLDAVRVAIEEFPNLPKIVVELATLRQIQDDVFPIKVSTSESAWYALRQLRGSLSMPLFRTYVENKFALSADASTPPVQEMVSWKLGYLGLSVDLKAVWRNFRRWRQVRRPKK